MSADGEPVETVEVIGARTTGPVETLPLPYTIVVGVPLDLGGSGLGLQEVLLTTPGALVRNRTNAPQGPRISIRGFGARAAFGVRGVTVLLDGIPLTLADGLAQLDGVDPDLLGARTWSNRLLRLEPSDCPAQHPRHRAREARPAVGIRLTGPRGTTVR